MLRKDISISREWIINMLIKTIDNLTSVPCEAERIQVTEITHCLLKAWFRRKGYPMEVYRISMLGGLQLHKLLEDELRKEGFLIEYPVDIVIEVEGKPIHIVGRIDAYHPKQSIVLEFKFREDLPDKPYKPHLLQTAFYTSVVGAHFGYLIYISKKIDRKLSSGVKIFRIRNDQRLFKLMLERAKKFYLCLVKGEPPKPEISGLCSVCEYQEVCKKLRRALRKEKEAKEKELKKVKPLIAEDRQS